MRHMFPHLLPCPTETIDLASPVAVLHRLASSGQGNPKAEVVSADTDSEKDESFSPVTPKDRTWEPARLLRRELPHCPATCRVERAALCLLRCEEPPRKQDLMRLFSMLPPQGTKDIGLWHLCPCRSLASIPKHIGNAHLQIPHVCYGCQ